MMDIIDMRNVRRDGISFTVKLVADIDARPEDTGTIDEGGCYTPADIAAWRADEWRYVGVIVETTMAQASVWGVEYGDFAGKQLDMDSILKSHVPDLLAEAYGG